MHKMGAPRGADLEVLRAEVVVRSARGTRGKPLGPGGIPRAYLVSAAISATAVGLRGSVKGWYNAILFVFAFHVNHDFKCLRNIYNRRYNYVRVTFYIHIQPACRPSYTMALVAGCSSVQTTPDTGYFISDR